MKKIISLLLLFAFCISLVSCGGIDIEAELQGEWIKSAEAQSNTQVSLYFSNGTVKRTEIVGESKIELSGVYTLDAKGYVIISYTDNTTQTLATMGSENGMVLRDFTTSNSYTKK